MSGTVILGCVLVLAGLGAAAFAQTTASTARAIDRARTYRCADIPGLAEAASSRGTGGVCEVAGLARPGDGGPLKAPESGRECVWYKLVVTEQYREVQNGSDGRPRDVERQRMVSNYSSESSFRLEDDSGIVAIAPVGATVDRAAKTYSRFVPRAAIPSEPGAAGFSIANLMSRTGSDGSLGVLVEEWTILPGVALYVLGEASSIAGEPVIAKPKAGRFIISTRSERELRRTTQLWAAGLRVAAIALVLGGVGMVVAGFVN